MNVVLALLCISFLSTFRQRRVSTSVFQNNLSIILKQLTLKTLKTGKLTLEAAGDTGTVLVVAIVLPDFFSRDSILASNFFTYVHRSSVTIEKRKLCYIVHMHVVLNNIQLTLLMLFIY